jgi:hypothetical protein
MYFGAVDSENNNPEVSANMTMCYPLHFIPSLTGMHVKKPFAAWRLFLHTDICPSH